ncbi:hypothetical protein BGX34_005288 [Mortierella sp. NVP85]|nr:hypothetical protein BGX34_005288 [Mortierella sp. NVP85]
MQRKEVGSGLGNTDMVKCWKHSVVGATRDDLYELDQTDYDNLFQKQFAQWGYTGVYKKRNGNKHDGCALFFRDQSVKAVSIVTVDYNQNSFIDRDNVGIVGVFDIQQGSQTQRVCIATTHILFTPSRGMIKIAQLRMLLERAKTLIDKEDKEIPLKSVDVSTVPESHMSGQFKGHIPTGSWVNGIEKFHEAFNHTNRQTTITAKAVEVVEPVIERPQSSNVGITGILDVSQSIMMSKSIIEGAQGPIISQPFFLRSAYDISAPSHDAKGSNRVPRGQPFTTYHLLCRQVCDYIFYGNLRQKASDSQAPTKLELVACLELPCKTLGDVPSLPTDKIGSDHLSLVSKFRFVTH